MLARLDKKRAGGRVVVLWRRHGAPEFDSIDRVVLGGKIDQTVTLSKIG